MSVGGYSETGMSVLNSNLELRMLAIGPYVELASGLSCMLECTFPQIAPLVAR